MYQWGLSPLLSFVCGPGCGCRFQPTCSHYFLEAVEVHGARRGVVLGVRRLARCHPWGGEGCDPVPRVRIDGAVTQLRRSPFEPVSK